MGWEEGGEEGGEEYMSHYGHGEVVMGRSCRFVVRCRNRRGRDRILRCRRVCVECLVHLHSSLDKLDGSFLELMQGGTVLSS